MSAGFRLQTEIDVINNMCFVNAELVAVGGATATIKTQQTLAGIIGGVHITPVAANSSIALTACAQQAAGTVCKYLISMDSSGNVYTTKGIEVSSTVLTAGTQGIAYLPALPANTMPIGYMNVTTDSITTFTAGTTLLNAAGLIISFVNIGTMQAEVV